MPTKSSSSALLLQRRRLIGRIEQEQEELEVLRALVENLADQLSRDEYMLRQVDSALGTAPQLTLEQANLRLRGQDLERVAVEVLQEERGADAEVHYREWFELLRARGYLVSGKQPINTFLAQIGRSNAVESVGRRTGRYRLKVA
ncbi:MAG TPA: hypothetical protein VFN89_11750 [Solirubrobacterales bacterium]|nr:hypothetical protein [Solirubrobacterales bacterium]